MKKDDRSKKAAGISDAAVSAATGKTWSEWFSILDRAGATRLSHKEIVAFLVKQHGVSPWWQQMVTVAYEQERGLREKHETPSGYQASFGKTIAVPISKMYKAWADAKMRARWLPERSITIRKATPNKSMRITWADGKSSVDVNFYSKGEFKSQVSLEHNKLANSKEVARMKGFWSKALEQLKKLLET